MKIQLSDHFTYRRLLKFVFPSVIMMIFTSIYGVIDGLFISNFVGKTSFAAINLVMPFIMVLGGFGFMIGTGGSALVAKKLGEGDAQKANQYFSMLVWFTLIIGIFFSIIGIVFSRPVAYFLGATESMIRDCVLYSQISFIFNTCYMYQNLFQSFLVTAEKPKLGLISTIAAGLTNIVLDALFIAVFHWGVSGAALATGFSQCVGAAIPFIFFARKNDTPLHIIRTNLKLHVLLKTCSNGASELLNNVASCIVAIMYNFQLLRFIGENGIAAYGVLMYIQFIFVAIYVGYAIGSAPIISYHYGAQNHNELKNMLKKSSLLMGISGICMTILAQFLAIPLAKIFVGYDAELFSLTVHAFRIFAFSFILCGMNIFASSFFTALNNGAVSAIISFLRTLVFQLICVFLLPVIFDIDGIWLAIAFAEVCAFIISLLFLISKRKQYHYI